MEKRTLHDEIARLREIGQNTGVWKEEAEQEYLRALLCAMDIGGAAQAGEFLELFSFLPAAPHAFLTNMLYSRAYGMLIMRLPYSEGIALLPSMEAFVANVLSYCARCVHIQGKTPKTQAHCDFAYAAVHLGLQGPGEGRLALLEKLEKMQSLRPISGKLMQAIGILAALWLEDQGLWEGAPLEEGALCKLMRLPQENAHSVAFCAKALRLRAQRQTKSAAWQTAQRLQTLGQYTNHKELAAAEYMRLIEYFFVRRMETARVLLEKSKHFFAALKIKMPKAGVCTHLHTLATIEERGERGEKLVFSEEDFAPLYALGYLPHQEYARGLLGCILRDEGKARVRYRIGKDRAQEAFDCLWMLAQENSHDEETVRCFAKAAIQMQEKLREFPAVAAFLIRLLVQYPHNKSVAIASAGALCACYGKLPKDMRRMALAHMRAMAKRHGAMAAGWYAKCMIEWPRVANALEECEGLYAAHPENSEILRAYAHMLAAHPREENAALLAWLLKEHPLNVSCAAALSHVYTNFALEYEDERRWTYFEEVQGIAYRFRHEAIEVYFYRPYMLRELMKVVKTEEDGRRVLKSVLATLPLSYSNPDSFFSDKYAGALLAFYEKWPDEAVFEKLEALFYGNTAESSILQIYLQAIARRSAMRGEDAFVQQGLAMERFLEKNARDAPFMCKALEALWVECGKVETARPYAMALCYCIDTHNDPLQYVERLGELQKRYAEDETIRYHYLVALLTDIPDAIALPDGKKISVLAYCLPKLDALCEENMEDPLRAWAYTRAHYYKRKPDLPLAEALAPIRALLEKFPADPHALRLYAQTLAMWYQFDKAYSMERICELREEYPEEEIVKALYQKCAHKK